MKRHSQGAAFIKFISAEALDSAAVNHPYLRAMSEGDFPNIEMALMDFAFQYNLYSARFTRYVSAVIENLSNTEHKQILLTNLAEEKGVVNDVELPPDVLASVTGQPHSVLFRRFQESLGVNTDYRETAAKCQTGLLWSRQFLQLCEMNECVGVGAIGIGTELIVSSIYNQILEGLNAHSDLTMTEHVFFNLHCQSDEQHAVQIALIAEDLARSSTACDQIEYGVKMAINMRVIFWDKMHERAQNFPASAPLSIDGVSAVGY
jgi:pyrroloquinoline quinone (PQQ) biosynthesis protein C